MIKLFENFDEPLVYKQMLKGYDVSLYAEPYTLRGARVAGCSVSWTLELEHRKWGIELGSFKLTGLTLSLEIEDPENEDEEIVKELEVPVESLGNLEKYKVSVEGFPLQITDLEINMRQTEDEEFWKYEVTLGKKED